MPAETLGALLEEAAASPEAGLRFVARDESARWLPWSTVRERAVRVAAGLAEIGVRPGERAALVYPTSPEFFDAFFGAVLAGAVPVPLYPPVRLGRLDEYHAATARMLRAAGAAVVLLHERVRKGFDGVLERYEPPRGAVALGALPAGRGPALGSDPDALALVQFSSGTTVDPKPVALTHRAVLAQTRILNGFWPDAPGLRHTGASWLPLYHDMGLIGCVLPALERPSVLTLVPPEAFVARPAIWLRTLSRYRATISPAPNFAFALATARIRDEELDGVDLSSWRVAPNGAEAISPGVLRAFRDRFSRWGLRPEVPTPVYGLSECALAVTFSDPARPFLARRFDRDALARGGPVVERDDGHEIVSVGRPVPGFEIEIRDDRRRSLPDGRVGRIWARGSSMMRGYLDLPGPTAEALRDGWLDTGDLGFVYAGELFLTGRAKDVVVLRGRNHDPGVIEAAVADVPGVREGRTVAASVLDDDAGRETLLLIVEVAGRTPAGERAALPARCADAVLRATGLVVDRVAVVEPGALPRTSSGKVRRAETVRRLLDGRLGK